MKKSHSFLSTLSILFTILGYLSLIIGILYCAYLFKLEVHESEMTKYELIFLVTVVMTLLASSTFWAMGQFIKLGIGMAENINTMNENIFFIADLLAKNQNTSSEKPLGVVNNN